MAASEATAAEREQRLAELRRRMGRAAPARDMDGYAELQAEYAAAKAEHSAASDREMKAAVRARRAQERALAASVAPPPWRLPAGFGTSPGAAERARSGRRREEPVKPARGLNPWRGGWHPAQTKIWRP